MMTGIIPGPEPCKKEKRKFAERDGKAIPRFL